MSKSVTNEMIFDTLQLISGRLDQMDKRLDHMDKRMDEMHANYLRLSETMIVRFNQVDERLNQMEDRLDEMHDMLISHRDHMAAQQLDIGGLYKTSTHPMKEYSRVLKHLPPEAFKAESYRV